MKRMMLTGALLVAGAAAVLAQPTTAPPAQAAPAQPAAPKGPAPKSAAELTALQAWQAAAQANDPDALIKATDEVLTKFPDTDFKPMLLSTEASAYLQKKDWIKAQIFGEQALAADPKSFQASLVMADAIGQHIGDHDLDRDEKIAKAEKYAHQTIDLLNTAPKPRPDITDDQWTGYKKPMIGQAYHDIALAEMTRKGWDASIAAFKSAIENDPQPAYEVQMAQALQQSGKNDEAIATCDKVLAEPNLHPAIASAAKGIKAAATQAKGGK